MTRSFEMLAGCLLTAWLTTLAAAQTQPTQEPPAGNQPPPASSAGGTPPEEAVEPRAGQQPGPGGERPRGQNRDDQPASGNAGRGDRPSERDPRVAPGDAAQPSDRPRGNDRSRESNSGDRASNQRERNQRDGNDRAERSSADRDEPELSPQREREADLLSYLPAAATAVVVAAPHKLSETERLNAVPWEVVRVRGERMLGFDPLLVEEVMLAMVSPVSGVTPPGGVALRFVRPVREEHVEPHLTAAEVPIAGHTCHAWKQRPEILVCHIDERTLLAGPRPVLEAMLTAGDRTSLLREQIQSGSGPTQLTAAAAMANVRPLLQIALSQVAQLPPRWQALSRLPGLVAVVQLEVDFDDQIDLALRLRSHSEGTASELHRLLTDLRREARAELQEQMINRGGESDAELRDAYRQYAERMSQGLRQRVKLEQQGAEVVISASIEGDAVTLAAVAGMVLPALRATRDSLHTGSSRSEATNHLKSIGQALHQYHEDHGHFPPAYTTANDGRSLLSWRVHLLPYLGERELYEQFHLDEPWDSEQNRELLARLPSVYANLRAAGDGQATQTSIVAVRGEGTVFGRPQGMAMNEITDGTSNTIVVVEAAPEMAVEWTAPEDYAGDVGRLSGLSHRDGGFLALFADGSVRQIDRQRGAEQIHALLTAHGGEVVRADR